MSSEVKRTPRPLVNPCRPYVRSSNGRRRASFGAKNCCVCSPTGLEPTIFSAPSHAPINVLHYNCPMTRILCHVQKNARTGLINLTPLSQRSRRLRKGPQGAGMSCLLHYLQVTLMFRNTRRVLHVSPYSNTRRWPDKSH